MTTHTLLTPGAAVYGVIMNDQASLARLTEAAGQPPYRQLPLAPVLYLKPRNTWAGPGAVVAVPADAAQVEVGAVLGLRMGRDAARLSAQNALDAVDACILAADLSLPHDSYYRPAVRQKCFDGSLPMMPLPAQALAQLDRLVLDTVIDGQPRAQRALADLVRPPAQLLADVTEFMTLRQGDVLLLGVVYQAPLADIGASVQVQARGLDTLAFTITQEARA
ncbi:fumarylacetoacetate hydrolase family protein [Castellaniella hirudinis]|uniref:fumarylacetoacetate hydrolase family protein n=1 Tax=Castellaniella hirudinis TaxID=1144617 RepID=UPI0039C1BA5A